MHSVQRKMTLLIRAKTILKISILVGVLLSAGLLAGCAGVVRPVQNQQDHWLPLPSGESLGQTFLVEYDGFSGVTLNLRTDDPAAGFVILRIFERTPERSQVAESALEISAGESLGARSFTFSGLPDTTRQDYLMEISFNGQGSLEVAAGKGETYLNGAAYVNGTPQDAQLAFGLQYATPLMIYGLALDGFRWLVYLFAAFVLFCLPGWALMDIIWHRWRDWDLLARLGVSGSVGLALYPVLFLWFDLVKIKPGFLLAWLPPLIGAGILAWRYRRFFGTRPRLWPSKVGTTGKENNSSTTVLFAILFLVVIAMGALGRFWVIRNLEVPMWGDSVQHTVMAQLMLDNKGLFADWLPYTPYDTLTIHYGFASMTAVFAWLTGLAAEQAALVVGQVLNLMAVLAIYPLALWASKRNRWVGLGAVLLAGLLLPIPGIYVNWGRYAQLAGQAILPGLIWMTVGLLQAPRPAIKHIAVMSVFSGFVLAGMALSYYRVPIYYAAFAAAWLIFWFFLPENRSAPAYQNMFISLGLTAVAALIFLLPWIPRLLGSTLGETAAGGMVRATPLEARLTDFSNWRFLPEYVPWVYLGMAILGAGWAVVRRHWGVVCMLLWVFLMVAYYFGGLVQLPAANMLQTFAVVILLYVPVGILGGYAFGEFAVEIGRALPRVGTLLIAGVVLVLAVWGGVQQARLGDPFTYALFTRPDLHALKWIEENTDNDSLILVEGFSIYAGDSSVGSDGGWWLPLFSRRQNTMPPQYALLNEQPIVSGYSTAVTNLVTLLEAQPISNPQVVANLCSRGISHVYIGQRQGEVGANARQLYAPEDLLASPAFELVYHQDRAYLFELVQQACPDTP